MYRFTTPTHTFKFDTEVSDFSEILITYAQSGKIVLEKHKGDLTISADGKEASFKLTQEESALFEINKVVLLQVRVLTNAGDSFASNVAQCHVAPVLHNGVLI